MYPDSILNKLKYAFWRVYTPYHPAVRDLAVKLGIVHHEGRQEWLIGTVSPHSSRYKSLLITCSSTALATILSRGRQGQLVSLRHADNFFYQYHLRVFEDREVRAHYEYTPESPILHVKKYHIEPKRDYFLNVLKDTVVPRRVTSCR